MSLSLRKLAESLQLEYRGNGDIELTGVASLKSAGESDLSFIQQRRYLTDLDSSRSAALIVTPELAGAIDDRAILISDHPHDSFVRAIELLGVASNPPQAAGIHRSAQVAPSASLGEGVSVGAQVVIGEHARVGRDTVIGPGSVVGDSAEIGAECRIHPRVTLGHAVRLGDRCEIHSGAVIGADGFGLVEREGEWRKIPQLGRVIVGDDVEIGANTTVDRGALDDTVIERGCKLDNLIQVAHNVRIGEHTAIAACVGIAGSATIGRYCKISGGVGILGHLTIADRVTVTAMSLVTKDIREAGVYSSGTPLMENSQWHRANARYKTLDRLAQRVRRLQAGREPAASDDN